MNMECQHSALEDLAKLVESDRHTIIITGPSSSGKTYLAKEWGRLLGIHDFYMCSPVVSDIKATIDLIVTDRTSVVLCIENLDNGQVKAAYPLLKLLEECPEYLYICVTCSNVRDIPDTIISRCSVVDVGNPSQNDLSQYAKSINSMRYEALRGQLIWKCAKGFADVKEIIELDANKLDYFNKLSELIPFKDTISNISWKLQNYNDNSKTNLEIVIRYMYYLFDTPHDKQSCIKCLNELNRGAISKNAVLSKFIMENKYCE